MKTVYDFTAKNSMGFEQSLSSYKGKVLLIVNTASQCSFTPQYAGLQALYERYRDQGFEVLAFPCNQFQNQEPGSNTEIREFCQVNFNVTFPLFDKVDVNGDHAHPLFQHLKEAVPGFLGTRAIKWNFTKFLVDRNGIVTKRFAPQVEPEAIESDIKELLAAPPAML